MTQFADPGNRLLYSATQKSETISGDSLEQPSVPEQDLPRLPEVFVGGRIKKPGLYPIKNEGLTPLGLIELAGGIVDDGLETLFVSIERQGINHPTVRYLPATLLSAPGCAKFVLQSGDRVNVISLRRTSLGRPGVRGQTLGTIKAAGRLQGVASINLAPSNQRKEIVGDKPTLHDLIESFGQHEQNFENSIIVLTRNARELGLREIYSLPIRCLPRDESGDSAAINQSSNSHFSLTEVYLRDGDFVEFAEMPSTF